MFVGEAPGADEDRLGLPFVGQAGKLLDQLLQGIGLAREDVFIANVLKCRPPGNRDPAPSEIEHCRGWLSRQLELIEPVVVCTLGNFATKLLRGEPIGITRLHGREEVRRLGPRAVRLYPLFHPAAALYTPSNVEILRADFARIPSSSRSGRRRSPGRQAAPQGMRWPIRPPRRPVATRRTSPTASRSRRCSPGRRPRPSPAPPRSQGSSGCSERPRGAERHSVARRGALVADGAAVAHRAHEPGAAEDPHVLGHAGGRQPEGGGKAAGPLRPGECGQHGRPPRAEQRRERSGFRRRRGRHRSPIRPGCRSGPAARGRRSWRRRAGQARPAAPRGRSSPPPR